jgi:2-octaprenyl-6-methoxyphenol hydroxylase
MTQDVDLLIVGGGLIGAAMAVAAEHAGLSWLGVDKANLDATLAPVFDGRVTSISYGSHAMLDVLGVWSHVLEPSPIDDIRVSDDGSPWFLHFDHREVGDRPFGYMVENRHLRLALTQAMAKCRLGGFHYGTEITELNRGIGTVTAVLSGGETVRAALLVAADGRHSALRQQAGIKQLAWDYGQTAIVCVVKHSLGHENMALEHFLPNGPFALLPMTEDRSALVWSEQADTAKTVIDLPAAEFDAEIMARAGEYYGEISCISKRWSFPLGLSNSERYIDQRLVLIGDAAHAMHPIAGQGLNLGLRDVAALAEMLYDAAGLGLDLGAAGLLGDYQRWRRFDAFTMLAMTDGLNRGFSTRIAPVKLARDLGLGMVQNMPSVKKFFERRAAAMAGDLPKLIRGLPLPGD